MDTEIKFCGMTRAEDVAAAVQLGASHIGVIFAGGPRMVSPSAAAELIRPVPRHVGRVGVFDTRPAAEIAATARAIGLSAVQLHGDPDTATIDALRRDFDGAVWAVLRVAGAELPARAEALFESADAVVLDALVAGRLGGTGVTLPWQTLAAPLARVRHGARLVLAGGLRFENVGAAIEALHPDVVDVSSGVESAPGVKDHNRMRAFRDAVRGAIEA